MTGRSRLRLTRIRIYPLKGGGGVDLQEAQAGPLGIPGDRRWMVMKPNGAFISQRTHPRLCMIRVASDGGVPPPSLAFSLEAPSMASLPLRPFKTGDWVEVRVHRDRFKAMVGDLKADRWLTAFLREPCRLAFFPEEARRTVDPHIAPGHPVGFADGYPLHLTTEESLADLNRHLSRPSSMLRFRPNLVVAGGRAWEEDEWRVLQVGAAKIGLVKPCARCSVTTVDQGTGVREREPLRTMKGIRSWEGKVYFGQNGVTMTPGRFRVGDDVGIVEKGSRRPPLPPDSRAG